MRDSFHHLQLVKVVPLSLPLAAVLATSAALLGLSVAIIFHRNKALANFFADLIIHCVIHIIIEVVTAVCIGIQVVIVLVVVRIFVVHRRLPLLLPLNANLMTIGREPGLPTGLARMNVVGRHAIQVVRQEAHIVELLEAADGGEATCNRFLLRHGSLRYLCCNRQGGWKRTRAHYAVL